MIAIRHKIYRLKDKNKQLFHQVYNNLIKSSDRNRSEDKEKSSISTYIIQIHGIDIARIVDELSSIHRCSRSYFTVRT